MPIEDQSQPPEESSKTQGELDVRRKLARIEEMLIANPDLSVLRDTNTGEVSNISPLDLLTTREREILLESPIQGSSFPPAMSSENSSSEEAKSAAQMKKDFRADLTKKLSSWMQNNPDHAVFYSVDGNYTDAIGYYMHVLTMAGVPPNPSEEDVDMLLVQRKERWENSSPLILQMGETANAFFRNHGLPEAPLSIATIHIISNQQSADAFNHDPTTTLAAKVKATNDIIIQESTVASSPELLRISVVHEATHTARTTANLEHSPQDDVLIEEGFTHATTKQILKEAGLAAELKQSENMYPVESWLVNSICRKLQLDLVVTSHDALRQQLSMTFGNEIIDPYRQLITDIHDMNTAQNIAEAKAQAIPPQEWTEEKRIELLHSTLELQKEIINRWGLN